MVCVPVFLPGSDPVFLFEGEIKKNSKQKGRKMSFEENKVLVYSGGTQVGDGASSVTGTTLQTGAAADSMYVGRGAKVSDISIYEGGVMYVDHGGSASGIILGGFGHDYSLISGGSMIVSSGAFISNIEVNGGLYSGGGVISGSTKNYGAITGTSATMNISGATFKDNHAEDFNGYNAVGGGLEIYVGTLDIKDTLFTSNSAEDGFAVDHKGAAGGAVCAMSAAVTMSGATFTANKAHYGGAYQQQGGTLILEDSEFTKNSGGSGGAVEFHNGADGSIGGTLFTSNSADCGGAVYNDIYTEYFYDSSWTEIVGSQTNICDLSLLDNTFSGNIAANEGGAVYNYAKMTVSGGIFSKNSAGQKGGAVANVTSTGEMLISGVTFIGNTAASGGAIYNGEGAVMIAKDICCTTETDTVSNEGQLTLTGKNSFKGAVVNQGSILIDAASFTEMVVDDLSRFSGSGSYALRTDLRQSAGRYVIAGNAAEIKLDTITIGETESTSLYSAAVAGNELYHSICVTEQGDLVLSVNRYFSAGIELDADSCVEFSLTGDFSAALCVRADAVNAVNMEGTLYYRVVKNGAAGETLCLTNTVVRNDADVIRSAENEAGDIFFAKVSGSWDAAHQARNTVSGETAVIAGKNRICDVFAGSDNNILYLTDDDNGDALFLDDIFSAIADGVDVKSARLSRISEIRAGAGSDVVDLTIANFTPGKNDGMICRGGAGDDVIFAASGKNKLFGDGGNDRISGGTEDDLICGGAGNDILNGCGGNDIFAFGSHWGCDVVRQNEDGTVTLWIEGGSWANWSETDRVYSDGTNTITVEGSAKVTLKFDADPELAALGAFAETTTEHIFESAAANGVIATL